MATREEGRASGRKAQADAAAFVHGTKDPRQVLRPRPRPTHAPAGPYELVAAVWHQPAKDERGKPFTKKRRRGDVVELDSDTAERLLRAGAVKPVTAEGEEYADEIGPSAQDKAADYLAANPLATPAEEDGLAAVPAPEGTAPGTTVPRLEG